MSNLENIKTSLARLEKWEGLADDAEKAYEAEPENLDREEAFEHAYELEYQEMLHLMHVLSKTLDISEITARKMIATKRDELKKKF